MIVLIIGSYIIDMARIDPWKIWNGMREQSSSLKIVHWNYS